ncbi:hypothetical protein BVX98_01585 [bacterium F11]|nr:hypothetical protein BVX98_01585 [bacterium F11]
MDNSSASVSPKRILLVDDDDRLLRLWSRVLQKEGFETVTATNGSNATEKIKSSQFGVIFSDLNMPEMNGADLIDYCKRKNIPSCINIFTGAACLEGAVQCIKKGACDYVAKPFSPHELAAMAYRCLQHHFQGQELMRLQKNVHDLEELGHLKSELVSNLSHELRTPLFSLGASLELLFHRLPDKEDNHSQKLKKIILSNHQRINQLVNNFLDFSKIEEGVMVPKFQQVDIIPLVQGIMRDLSPLMMKNSLEWNIEVKPDPENPIEANLDPDQITQVLVNLLGNAIKFTPPGQKIGLTVSDEGSNILMDIWDKGRGIPPEHLNRVFDRFFQLDTSSTREYGGVGIGLPIVRSIIERHGGDVWFESSLGIGSDCFIRLPKTHHHLGERTN